jgi:hypothetical protein
MHMILIIIYYSDLKILLTIYLNNHYGLFKIAQVQP